MPELPEVETVVRGLSTAITGLRVEGVLLRRKDVRIPFPKDLAKQITGQTIRSVTRRAKYILITFSNDQVMIAHLGMSGKFLVKQGRVKDYDTHDHMVCALSGGKTLLFNDPRRFGVVTLANAAELSSHALLANLGPEPLSRDFDETYLLEVLKHKKQPIKNAIMDQHLVVGVGNIYAAESLFLSGINPQKPAEMLIKMDVSRLVKNIKVVLEAAIKSGGSTLRDYVRSSGDVGYFQHHFNVYGRQKLPCFTCKSPILMIRQAGRSTFYCARCQK